MKKHFLNRVNLVLGALSLTLAGCHSSKQAGTPREPAQVHKYGVVPPREVIALYGVQFPDEIEVLPTDTADAQQPEQQDIIMTKYGIPAPLFE